MINRRMFLKSTGFALAAGGLLPNVFVRMAEAGTTGGRKVLVAIFLRGAVDGLNVVVPYGEKNYYSARPTIAIPRPGSGENAAIDLDGFFGVHSALAPLTPLFRDKSLAFVQAVGSPDPSRSHFDAQDFMESGTPGVKTTEDGFLSRAITSSKAPVSPLRAVALSPALPRILSGSAGAIAMTDVQSFGIRGAGSEAPAVSDSLQAMYDQAVADTLKTTAKESFEAARILKATDPSRARIENGADYPAGPVGKSLQQIAQLIKSDVGLEVAFTDVSGWDTHTAEAAQLNNNLKGLAAAIFAFTKDLGSRMNDVVLVTMSEFGRTVHENGNRGTDHGHGNFMLVAGGGVNGGKVHGKWPGLGDRELYESRDLAVTTDFRDVFGALISKHLGVSDLKKVFPGYPVRTDAIRILV